VFHVKHAAARRPNVADVTTNSKAGHQNGNDPIASESAANGTSPFPNATGRPAGAALLRYGAVGLHARAGPAGARRLPLKLAASTKSGRPAPSIKRDDHGSLECSSACIVDAAGKDRLGVQGCERTGAADRPVRHNRASSRADQAGGRLSVSMASHGDERRRVSGWSSKRHVTFAMLKSMPVKSDRNDARGIVQLIRLGWFWPVHATR
jgi:hypothetical protein